MNLIESKYIDYPIFQFRELQYKKYRTIIKCCLDHIDKHSKFFHTRSDFDLQHIIPTEIDGQYQYIKCNKLFHTIVKPFKDDNIALTFLIPMLMSRQYFYISSTYYLPVIQISNKPIAFNDSAIIFQSILFDFVCYNHKGAGMVKFMGTHYNIDHFLLLLFKGNIDKISKIRKLLELCPKVEIKKHEFDEFVKEFKTNTGLNLHDSVSLDNCCELINSLFFDEYTKNDFMEFYKCADLNQLFDEQVFENNDPERFNFINLNNKRLQFIEPIIYPITRNIFKVFRNSIKGVNIFKIEGGDAIVKNFFSELKGKFIYKSVNGLSTLETNATFAISGRKTLPNSINSIDSTFKNRICPVTVSGDNIGETVSLVSDININVNTGEFL